MDVCHDWTNPLFKFEVWNIKIDRSHKARVSFSYLYTINGSKKYMVYIQNPKTKTSYVQNKYFGYVKAYVNFNIPLLSS